MTMHATAPAAAAPAGPELSARLRAGVALYPGPQGLMLRVGDAHHHVNLGPSDAGALLDALVEGSRPPHPPATQALEALVDAGLVDPIPATLDVVGGGLLAAAIRAALVRMGIHLESGGSTVLALDHVEELPSAVESGTDVCWACEDLVLLAPPGVSARDVAARRRAAIAHRNNDPRTQPLTTGRTVVSAHRLPAPGLELAAVSIAAELIRADRPTYEVLAIDLHELRLSRRPVLPVPQAPR